jgi:hypothetical protein
MSDEKVQRLRESAAKVKNMVQVDLVRKLNLVNVNIGSTANEI